MLALLAWTTNLAESGKGGSIRLRTWCALALWLLASENDPNARRVARRRGAIQVSRCAATVSHRVVRISPLNDSDEQSLQLYRRMCDAAVQLLATLMRPRDAPAAPDDEALDGGGGGFGGLGLRSRAALKANKDAAAKEEDDEQLAMATLRHKQRQAAGAMRQGAGLYGPVPSSVKNLAS